MAINTGLGATAVFSVTAIPSNFVSMDLTSQTLPTVNTSYLGSVAYEQYIPGDLSEPGTVTFEAQFDAEEAQVVLGTVETLTVTLPLGTGEAVAGTWAGTGFISEYKPQQFIKNELQASTITFSWDGQTAPTYTPATTV
jgi:hypothetical protein